MLTAGVVGEGGFASRGLKTVHRTVFAANAARPVLISPSQSHKTKPPLTSDGFLLVGEGGFEPPKSLTTDLQSAPFGHSGTLPHKNMKLYGAGGRT